MTDTLTAADLTALPTGSVVRYATERGMRPAVAIKATAYGADAERGRWYSSDSMAPVSSLTIAGSDPVLLAPVEAVDDLAEAIRLTVEYVGTDTLPALPGWAWFDALSRYRPDLADAVTSAPTGPVVDDVVHFSPYGATTSVCGLHKPPTEDDFTDRRALTTCPACLDVFKALADVHTATCGGDGAPVSDTRREDVARAEQAGAQRGWDECLTHVARTAQVGSAGLPDECYEGGPSVLAVLPAPPVVDEAPVVERADPRWVNLYRHDIRHAYAAAGPGDYVQRAAHFDAVMAPPVVDEAEILDCMTETWAAHIGVGDPVTPSPSMREMASAVAARLRGATRG